MNASVFEKSYHVKYRVKMNINKTNPIYNAENTYTHTRVLQRTTCSAQQRAPTFYTISYNYPRDIINIIIIFIIVVVIVVTRIERISFFLKWFPLRNRWNRKSTLQFCIQLSRVWIKRHGVLIQLIVKSLINYALYLFTK